jgi:signal transduction histidine kinase
VVCGPPNRIGETAPQTALRRGLEVELDGRVVGYLLAGDNWNDRRPLSPEMAFLVQVNRIIGLSALAAMVIALFLGGMLARTLTRPLRELTAATQDIARGELGRQVPVRSRDELGALASSFNRMSADLDKSTRLRKQMTADVAHDLRTPLSLILGYTEALSDGKLPGDPEIYTVMHREAQHLNRLIDDLRLLSLADAGELPLNRTPISPVVLLERAASAFRAQAAAKDITLRLDAAGDLPPVDVDPERIAQVLGNLLSNGLRHTPPGGQIVLSAAAPDGSVLLRVHDTGPGIDPADLPYIFNRFYRADKSRAEAGESGLGLSIARSLVEAHGGSISAESAPSQGATFSIWLPAAVKPQ